MIWVWRHPRPDAVSGLCIGAGVDPPVHWRRSKRLARRIQAHARRHRLAHRIITSPLRRCADAGRWLRRWGWEHSQRADLSELHFGTWEGQRWSDIPKADIDAWVLNFAHHAPGGGQSLNQLLQQVARCALAPQALVISHGGWMLARQWLSTHGSLEPQAHQWPQAPHYGECWGLPNTTDA
jgi:alpha-ribazole phosphatase